MALFRTGLYVKNHSVEKVQVAKTPIASYNGNVTGLYIPELIAYITARQSGSGTPAPDNIRPIIGASECNVVRCGKNLFNYDLVTPYNAQVIITRNDGVITIQNNNAYQLNALNGNSFFLSSGSYTVSIEESLSVAITVYKGSTYHSRAITAGDTSGVITISEDGVYNLTCNILGNSTLTIKKLQIEIGSTATAYEAYTGNTYIIQLGDTYYGCSLNVTTGVLTIIGQLVTLNGSETWQTASSGDKKYFVSKILDYGEGVAGVGLSNEFAYANVTSSSTDVGFRTLNSSGYNAFIVNVRPNNVSSMSVDDFKTFLSGSPMQLVYELATPTTYQLTPTQVEQLLGQNNLWADTGNVAVKFYNVIR